MSRKYGSRRYRRYVGRAIKKQRREQNIFDIFLQFGQAISAINEVREYIWKTYFGFVSEMSTASQESKEILGSKDDDGQS